MMLAGKEKQVTRLTLSLHVNHMYSTTSPLLKLKITPVALLPVTVRWSTSVNEDYPNLTIDEMIQLSLRGSRSDDQGLVQNTCGC